MHLNEIPESRRAVRQFDSIKPIEPEVVRNCLKSARLAPTSSNLQLWEACHITEPEMLKNLTKALLEFERKNVNRYSLTEKKQKHIKQW